MQRCREMSSERMDVGHQPRPIPNGMNGNGHHIEGPS